ncbi:MAG: hypothetical protein ACTSU5_10840 [Promethearchaeota archaeon]
MTEDELNVVLSDIERTFPTFAGGVFVDTDGFLLAERKRDPSMIEMNLVGLAAVAGRRLEGISEHIEGYQKVRRDFGSAHLFVLLEKKPKTNLPLFNHLRKIVKRVSGKLDAGKD